MRPSRQLPAVDASARIRYLDIVQALLERLFCVSLVFGLVDGGEALRERILVDVELVVELGIRIARQSLICHDAIDD